MLKVLQEKLMTKRFRKKKRDYRKEYDRDQAGPEDKKNRAARNRNRAEAEKAGRVHKGDGKEISHKTPLARGGSNSDDNLEVVSRKSNRNRRWKLRKKS